MTAEHGTPEWHAAEAEEHLARADELAAKGHHQQAAARLLAATANASLAALKLALRQDAMLAEAVRDLRNLSDYAEAEWARRLQ